MLDIKFSLSGSTADKDVLHQARAVVATLRALFGDGVLPTDGIFNPAPARSQLGLGADTPAPDGYPTAADAFAGSYGTTDKGGVGPDGMIRPEPETEEDGPAPTGDLDVNGLPWDERIHSETRNTNKDGSWRNRRNLDKTVLETVTAELKSRGTPAQETAVIPPPPAPTPVPPPPPSAPAPTTPAVPAPSPVPAAPAASSTAPVTFPTVMVKITGAQRDGKIDKAGVDGLLASLGLSVITDLHKNPDMLPAFDELLNAAIGA